MPDPRGAEAMMKFRAALTEVQTLGERGFAYLLDMADKDEMDDLIIAAEVILDSVARTKAALAGQPKGG